MRSGDLRERIGFYPPIQENDGAGNTTNGYTADAAFVVSANVKPKLGGEKVLADRLTGTNLVNVTIRSSTQSLTIEEDWRAKDERTGTLYNIRSIIDPTQRHAWIELLCEKGVAS